MKIARVIILVAFTFLLISLFVTVPVMLLWNWLMPDIFGLPVISFWQALGLAILVRIMFAVDKIGRA